MHFKKQWIDRFGIEVVRGKWNGICIASNDQIMTQSLVYNARNSLSVKMEEINVAFHAQLQRFHEISSGSSQDGFLPVEVIMDTNESVSSKSSEKDYNNVEEDDDNDDVYMLGKNGNTIPYSFYQSLENDKTINPSQMTRKLLSQFFPRDILATHTLSGKPSPAFQGREKPTKGQLNSSIIEDIIEFVCGVTQCNSRHVRSAITTKCADENKVWRNRSIQPRKRRRKTMNLTKRDMESRDVDLYFNEHKSLYE